MHAPLPLQRTALAGLRSLAGPEATSLIELLAAHADATLRPEAEAALASRPHGPGGRRG
jgi:hypothetical protein